MKGVEGEFESFAFLGSQVDLFFQLQTWLLIKKKTGCLHKTIMKKNRISVALNAGLSLELPVSTFDVERFENPNSFTTRVTVSEYEMKKKTFSLKRDKKSQLTRHLTDPKNNVS